MADVVALASSSRRSSHRRLVLDTNCFRGLEIAAVRALASAGFRLSVSMIGLEEWLARGHRGEGFVALRRRAGALTPFLDRHAPLTPVGSPLFYALGATFGMTRDRMYSAHNAELPARWARMADADDDAELRTWAESLNTSIDRNAETVRSAAEDARQAPAEDEPLSVLRGQALADLGRAVSLRHGAQERLHAYGSCLAQMIHGSRNATPATNDSEDIQLLEHLSDDVVLLTRDGRFIERVDRTGSFQAPFLRTPAEVLSGRLPPGPPWGPSARRAVRTHAPRSRVELAQFERAFMAGLLATARQAAVRAPALAGEATAESGTRGSRGL